MDLYSFFYEAVVDPIVDRNTRALKSMEFRQPPAFQLVGKAVFGDIIDPENDDLYSLELKKIRKKGYTPEPPVAYEGFGDHEGEYVLAADALHYAMKQCGIEPIKKIFPRVFPRAAGICRDAGGVVFQRKLARHSGRGFRAWRRLISMQ